MSESTKNLLEEYRSQSTLCSSMYHDDGHDNSGSWGPCHNDSHDNNPNG